MLADLEQWVLFKDVPSSAKAVFSVQRSAASAPTAAFSDQHSLSWAQTLPWQKKNKGSKSSIGVWLFLQSSIKIISNIHLNGTITCKLFHWLHADVVAAPQTSPLGGRWLSPSVSSGNKRSVEQRGHIYLGWKFINWLWTLRCQDNFIHCILGRTNLWNLLHPWLDELHGVGEKRLFLRFHLKTKQWSWMSSFCYARVSRRP